MGVVDEAVEYVASLSREASVDDAGALHCERGVVGWKREGQSIEVYRRWAAVSETPVNDPRKRMFVRDEWLAHPAVFLVASEDAVKRVRQERMRELVMGGRSEAFANEWRTLAIQAMRNGSWGAIAAAAKTSAAEPVGDTLHVADWILDDEALTAVMSAGVTGEFARTVRDAGFYDAQSLLEMWNSDVPVDFIRAMGGQ